MRTRWSAAIAAFLLAASPAAAQQAADAGLRIVVVAGEDAVNIIQQKTAVAPIIEVRDRNNLPVSGASVTFSIGQGASFGGQSTLTVVTNAAGQATATGLTPSAAGAIQIQATATFQGQTAVATIAQSNVLTAAEAAGAASGAGGTGSGSGGTSGATAGTGGGVGGGLSGATLGIIGGAVAGGALVATKAAGGGDSSSPSSGRPGSSSTGPTGTGTTPSPSPQPASSSFSGPLDGTITGTSTISVSGAPNENCSVTIRDRGEAMLRLTQSGGTNTGTLTLTLTQSVTASTCAGATSGVVQDVPYTWMANVSGSGNSIGFTQEFRDSGSQQGASWSTVYTIAFSGTVGGGVVTGTLTHSGTVEVRGDGFSSRLTMSGSFPLTLR